ncbi:MAG: hypothetical protein R2719_07660 [Micropruina sp.]
MKLGLPADEAVGHGVLLRAASACGPYSPSDLLGETRVYAGDGRVTAIDIRSAAFPSGRGVRVGTPLSELQAMYGADLVAMPMNDGGNVVDQWALLNARQYIAYLVDDNGTVARIAIGYRAGDGSITLPPPC